MTPPGQGSSKFVMWLKTRSTRVRHYWHYLAGSFAGRCSSGKNIERSSPRRLRLKVQSSFAFAASCLLGPPHFKIVTVLDLYTGSFVPSASLTNVDRQASLTMLCHRGSDSGWRIYTMHDAARMLETVLLTFRLPLEIN